MRFNKLGGGRKVCHAMLAALCLVILAGCGNEKSADAVQQKDVVRPVKTVVLGAVDKGGARTFPGTVRAAHRVDLAFRVAGQIESFPVKEGEHVEKGQELARLDDTDYRHAVGALEAALKGAQATSIEAALNYERQRELFERDMTPKASYDRALSALDQAKAAVERLEQELSNARANLSYTRLRAPFSGIVAGTVAEEYQTVAAGSPVLKLRDVKRLEVVVAVPEKDVADWRVGDEAKATFEFLPDRTASLTVTEVAAEASSATRTYAVTLAVAQGESERVLPGMTAVVSRDARAEKTDGFRVPVAAVFDDGAGQFVWKVGAEDGSVSRVAVTVGDMDDGLISIKGDVAPGDIVVAAGVHFLSEGQMVRLLDGGER